MATTTGGAVATMAGKAVAGYAANKAKSIGKKVLFGVGKKILKKGKRIVRGGLSKVVGKTGAKIITKELSKDAKHALSSRPVPPQRRPALDNTTPTPPAPPSRQNAPGNKEGGDSDYSNYKDKIGGIMGNNKKPKPSKAALAMLSNGQIQPKEIQESAYDKNTYGNEKVENYMNTRLPQHSSNKLLRSDRALSYSKLGYSTKTRK